MDTIQKSAAGETIKDRPGAQDSCMRPGGRLVALDLRSLQVGPAASFLAFRQLRR